MSDIVSFSSLFKSVGR